jgi:RNA polymerase sigma-70 factor (ECF subfamily)
VSSADEHAFSGTSQRERFQRWVLPHLDAAYNLARWLMKDEERARDMVQEACLRAFRHLDGFGGGSAKSWLLTIVRNVCFSELEASRCERGLTEFDEQVHSAESSAEGSMRRSEDPEAQFIRRAECAQLQRSLAALSAEYREVLVLRELEGLSYKEISAVAAIPLGTVMSRLGRARNALQLRLLADARKTGKP